MKKIILSLATIGIVTGVTLGITGAWWSSSAKSHNASFHSGTMNLSLYGCNSGGNNCGLRKDIYETWNQNNMEPGGTVLDKSLSMKNTGSIDAHRISFAVTGLSGDTDMAKQMRITKLEYGASENGNWNMKSLLTGRAGADLSNYVAPTHCDVTVDPSGTYKTIHDGIAAAASGQKVCVKHGDYTSSWETTHSTYSTSHEYPVTIDKNITLVSLEGPANTTITVTNGKDAIDINADNVTVKGFTVTGAVMGIYTKEHSGITITDNKIENYDGNGAEGIKIDGGSVTITNNVIEASATPNPKYSIDAIYTKGKATVTVAHNDLENNRYAGNVQTGNPDPGAWSTAAGIAVHQGDKVTAG